MFMEDYLRDGGVAENLFPAKEGKGSSTPQIKP